MTDTGIKQCRDCVAEGVTTMRPAPHPGPRCVTHHLAFRKVQKERSHEARVKKIYGLADGDYDALCEMQDGRCAICARARCVGSSGKHLAVDHDHVSGVPRGLLCVTCNRVLIGQYDAEALLRAVAYLADPPYSRLQRARMHA